MEFLDYVPEVMVDIEEFKQMGNALNPETKELWNTLQKVFNDQFINDATENGITRWEKILKIIPKSVDTLDSRKFRIMARLNQELPYTYTSLDQKITTLCGQDGYTLKLNAEIYTIVVRIALRVKEHLDDVNSFIRDMVPANIVIDISLMYNQQKLLLGLTHNYLHGYTHEQLRSEVIK